MLWYDELSLRDLVILDPQWVIDAACSIIRDYKLRDHTVNMARMAQIDQEAIRKEPDCWTALTEGRAILRQPLLHILWSSADFRDHKCAPQPPPRPPLSSLPVHAAATSPPPAPVLA